MADQIYIGANKGLKLNPLPFNIDNDAFATLYNAYVWRKRAKRKRGTATLARLQIAVQSVVSPNNFQDPALVLVAGAGNLISGFSLGASSMIVPFTISVTGSPSGNVYVDTNGDGKLYVGAVLSGTINYATGAIQLAGSETSLTGTFSYYPGNPVMGLEDFTSAQATLVEGTSYPQLIAFDTTNSYMVNQTGSVVNFYNVNYYKNTQTPFVWSGADYQQFWTTNYPDTSQGYTGSLWATNNKPGFNFKLLTGNPTMQAANATRVNVNIAASGLMPGDYLFFNEVTGAMGSGAAAGRSINGLTGIVATAGFTDGNFNVDFTGSNGTSLGNFVGGAFGQNGLAQYLTSSIIGQDGIKWFDGSPSSATTGLPAATGLGWVNFAPPLTAFPSTVSIDDTPPRTYYLVGALAILPFKDRLLFFAPWIQASDGTPIQLQDTVLWSWNGTPYYTALVPTGQTYDVRAYYVDQTGFGGYLPAGVSAPIKTITNNEDVLLIGFGGDGRKTRFVYTANDIQPFLFYNINSEMPSSATYAAITLDSGAIDIGAYGICMTDQQSSQRIDLDIPDSVFQIQALNFGVERVNGIRDYFREWIYFSYPVASSISPFGSNNAQWVFPTQTFMFNYRDNTWAIFYENFTRHGNYRAVKKKTWATTGYSTWDTWREPWNSGTGSPQYSNIIAGNPQGFVLIKGIGTGEAPSGAISAISANGTLTQITSTNHCVATNDYLLFNSSLGSTYLNGLIGRVDQTLDANNFVVDIPFQAGSYVGAGTYARLSQPLIQTKQFPFYWEQGLKTRLGVQRYLLDRTQSGQVTINIYLSQDASDAWNDPSNLNVAPNSLVYSQLLYTCPESTNIGLTPANTNLQMPTASSQFQIWHRLNTSLIGDSIQIGVTLSDAQMRNLRFATDEIALHGIHLSVSPSSLLA